MSYVLNALYLLLLILISPWLLYAAARKGKYREGYAEKLLGRVPRRKGGNPCLWFHAVSVGEVNLLMPLLGRLQVEQPGWECVVSTTTKTGYDLARRRFPELTVFYCPLDFTWAVRRAMQRIRPDVLVLTELEIWPNLIAAAKWDGAKVAVVNGRLGERSFHGYRRLRPLLGRTFRKLDLACAQTDAYAARFRALGVPANNVTVTGSIKFDGAETERNHPATERLRRLAGIREDDPVFLAGSTQEPEESLAVDAFCSLREIHPELRLILVPRHPERFEHVAGVLQQRGVDFVRRSELEIDHASQSRRESPPSVLLVDAVGELAAWWGTATVGYVGGSLGTRGGQNMIEPAACGVAVCFGPRTHNFRDVVAALLAADAARVVEDGTSLTAFVRRCLSEPEFTSRLGANARQLVLGQRGATEKTVALLTQLVANAPPGAQQAA